MAGEIQADVGTTGLTAYAQLRNAVGQIYRTTSTLFEAYNAANVADYDIAVTEQGSSGFYVGDMPAVAAGSYSLVVRRRVGAPAESDPTEAVGEIEWDGSAVVPLADLPTAAEVWASGTRTLTALDEDVTTLDLDATITAAVPSAVQIADAFLGRNIAGGSSAGRTVAQAFAAQRNKVAFDVPSAGSFTVYATDDSTPLWTGTYSASASADPVTAIDPT